MKAVFSGLTKENTPEHLQFISNEPTWVLRQNSSTIVAKNITTVTIYWRGKQNNYKLDKQYQTRNMCGVALISRKS